MQVKKDEIVTRAEEYIALERDDFFRNQVELLVQENDTEK